jgi:hypothetical protein
MPDGDGSAKVLQQEKGPLGSGTKLFRYLQIATSGAEIEEGGLGIHTCVLAR